MNGNIATINQAFSLHRITPTAQESFRDRENIRATRPWLIPRMLHVVPRKRTHPGYLFSNHVPPISAFFSNTVSVALVSFPDSTAWAAHKPLKPAPTQMIFTCLFVPIGSIEREYASSSLRLYSSVPLSTPVGGGSTELKYATAA